LTSEDIKRIRHEQQDLCAWCSHPLGVKFAVDHNHKTGQVRALMHIRCNTFAGWVEKWQTLSEAERQRRVKILM
jgi:hypothetical protein